MKNKRNKILIFLSILFVLAMSFVIPTYAWSVDSNGNLQSQNILSFDDGSYNGLGVTYQCSDNKIYLSGTATSSGPLWVNVSISSGSYVFQTFNDFTYNNDFRLTLRNGYSRILASCDYRSLNNQSIFTTTYDIDILAISVVSGVNYNGVVLTPSLVVGSTPLTSYETYGAIMYSESNMNKLVQANYGSFAFANSISIYYNDGTYDHLYKTYSSCYEISLETWCKFINGSIQIDDYGFIFVTCGGDSNWNYVLRVHYPSGSVKISNYNIWYLYGLVRFNFLCYDNTFISQTSSITANPLVLDLTNNSYNNLNENSYISDIVFSRYSPNVALPYGRIGTPMDSNYYNDGYNDGLNEGYDNGFDSGFTDGKNEGYTMGYNDGYRDGSTEDFTTNGFKTLIGSIFNYPINFIRGVFNFEFMGINISSIVFFVLSIGIVIFVVKRFKK